MLVETLYDYRIILCTYIIYVDENTKVLKYVLHIYDTILVVMFSSIIKSNLMTGIHFWIPFLTTKYFFNELIQKKFKFKKCSIKCC